MRVCCLMPVLFILSTLLPVTAAVNEDLRSGDYEAVLAAAQSSTRDRLRAWLMLGRYDELIKQHAESDDWIIRSYLSLAYRHDGQRDADQRLLQQALERAKAVKIDTAMTATALARIIGERDIKLAWKLVQDAHQLDATYVDAYLVGAEVCMAAFAWQYALEESYTVYKQDPQDLRAIAVAARAMIADNKYTRAHKLLDEGLAINQRFVPLLNLKALLALQKRNVEEMRTWLEQAMTVNPRNSETLALLASAADMAGEAEQRDRYIEEALQYTTYAHEVFALLAEAAERRYLYEAALAWGRKAQEVNPGHWQGDYISAINLLRLGEEQAGYTLLEQSFKKNGFNVWAYNMLTVLDGDFKQQAYAGHATEHFYIKIPRTIDAQLWPYLQRWLDPLYQEMAARYQYQPVGPDEYDGKILLLFFDKHDHFSARTAGLPGLGANGATFGKVITMPIQDRDSIAGAHPWFSTLEHELAHVFTIQKTNRHIPRWFTEGISEWQEGEAHIQLDSVLLDRVRSDELPSLAKLSDGIHYPESALDIGLYYYLSALAVEYFIAEYDEAFINTLLQELAAGTSMIAALEQHSGRDLTELNQRYHTWIRTFSKTIYAPLRISADDFTALAEAHAVEALQGQQLLRYAHGCIQQGRAAAAQKAALLLSDDDELREEGLILQARIALRFARNSVEALDALNQIIAIDGAHGPANYWAMRAALHEDDYDTAAVYAEAAIQALPRMTRGKNSPYMVLARYHEQQEDDAARLKVLQQLIAVDAYYYPAQRPCARLLYQAGRWQEAAAALERCIEFSIYDAWIHAALGHCYEELGRKVLARSCYQIALALDETEGIARSGLRRVSPAETE